MADPGMTRRAGPHPRSTAETNERIKPPIGAGIGRSGEPGREGEREDGPSGTQTAGGVLSKTGRRTSGRAQRMIFVRGAILPFGDTALAPLGARAIIIPQYGSRPRG